jgi:hypothetical protein
VYRTGIPAYKLRSSVKALGSGKFVVQGTIDQDEAPADFEMLVPLVALYDKGRKVPLGHVAVTDSSGRFRFTTATKPSKVAIDDDEILAVVR